MQTPVDTAPAAAPSLYDLHTALTTECAALRLIRNTLTGCVNVRIGEPVAPEMAEDLVASTAQLCLVMERIRRLSDRIDELDIHADVSHVCGDMFVLEALERSLRAPRAMSNVTPIRPGVPTQPPLPMRTDRIGPEVHRIHEVASMIELAERAMQQISGDEDPDKIVEELSVPAGALRNARGTLLDVAERLKMAQHEAGGEKS